MAGQIEWMEKVADAQYQTCRRTLALHNSQPQVPAAYATSAPD